WLDRYRANAEGPALAATGQETPADGHFSLDVEPGLYRAVARAAGFAEGRSAELDLAEGATLGGIRITLGAGGEVDGTVLGATGAPVGSGRVQALSKDERWPIAESAVDPSGHFALTGLPSGHLVIVADAAQARGSAEADLEEGGQAQVEIRLGSGTLDGMVDDGDGRPIAGALVVARPLSLGAAGERSTLSGSDGRFRLGGLTGDRFDLAATKDEGSAELRGVAAGSRDLRLSLAVGAVSGWVESPDGAGITDFTVAAEPELPGKGRPRSAHVFDARGEFKLVLAPGSYVLRANAPGYAEAKLNGVAVTRGEPTSGLHVKLNPSGTIEGLVLDASTGAPLVGIHVAVDRGHAWAVGRAASGAVATSGLDGSFVLRDVSPGRWPVFANSADFEMASPPPTVTVAPGGDPPPVELRMRRANQREQEYAGVGMSIWERAGHKFAAEVFEEGPAYDAGIRTGDEILAVDGAPAQPLALPDVVARIRGPVGSEVTLDMQRSGNGPGYEVVVPRGDIKMF
ncbi:MAG: carboxypeptidase regulatory-like domain-containing protein, partial [Deltaproteobacteria bacterium]